jgi:hypothetical protein
MNFATSPASVALPFAIWSALCASLAMVLLVTVWRIQGTLRTYGPDGRLFVWDAGLVVFLCGSIFSVVNAFLSTISCWLRMRLSGRPLVATKYSYLIAALFTVPVFSYMAYNNGQIWWISIGSGLFLLRPARH